MIIISQITKNSSPLKVMVMIIQNSEKKIETDLNSQFPTSTQSRISENYQPTQNMSQNFFQNAQLTRSNIPKHLKSWTTHEDTTLMYSYCIISDNPIVRADQKDDTFGIVF